MCANQNDEMKDVAKNLRKDIDDLYDKTVEDVLVLYKGEDYITSVLVLGGILNSMLSDIGSQSLADLLGDKIKILQVVDENESK